MSANKKVLTTIGVILIVAGVIIAAVFGVAYKRAYDGFRETELLCAMSSGVHSLLYYGTLDDYEAEMNRSLALAAGGVVVAAGGVVSLVVSRKKRDDEPVA